MTPAIMKTIIKKKITGAMAAKDEKRINTSFLILNWYEMV